MPQHLFLDARGPDLAIEAPVLHSAGKHQQRAYGPLQFPMPLFLAHAQSRTQCYFVEHSMAVGR